MKRNSHLRNVVATLLILAVLMIPFSLSVSGQGTTTTEVFFSNEVYMIPGASSGICIYASTMMPGTTGDTLTGTLSSDNSGGIAFAIMSTNHFVDFQQPDLNPGANPHSGASDFRRHTCIGVIESSDYHNEGQSFEFQWNPSGSDAYYLVMLNPNSDPIIVTLSANRITSAGGIGYSRTGSTNSISAHTSVYSSAVETPLASATSSQTVSPLALPFDPTYLAVILAVVALAAILLWRIRSKPHPDSQVNAPPTSQQTTQVRSEGQRQFCLNCGRQIPPGSRFCGKCGAAQTKT